MEGFKNAGAAMDELIRLNDCLLFLTSYYISDISTGDGSKLTEEAWNGRPNCNVDRRSSWLAQGRPPKQDSLLWQQFVKRCYLDRGQRLKSPLGKWLQRSIGWIWFYDTVGISLWSRINKGWLRNERVADTNLLSFIKTGSPCDTIPALLEPVSIYVKGHMVVLTGSAPLLYQSLPAYTSFLSYLQGFPEEKWCYSNISLSDDEYFFILALQSNCTVAVFIDQVVALLPGF